MEKKESKKSIFTHLLFLMIGFVFGGVITGAVERNKSKEDTIHMWRDRAETRELLDVIESQDDFGDHNEWIQQVEAKASEISERFERHESHIQSR